jgi:hypothetical protein
LGVAFLQNLLPGFLFRVFLVLRIFLVLVVWIVIEAGSKGLVVCVVKCGTESRVERGRTVIVCWRNSGGEAEQAKSNQGLWIKHGEGDFCGFWANSDTGSQKRLKWMQVEGCRDIQFHGKDLLCI